MLPVARVALAGLFSMAHSINLQIMVTSKWSHFERRQMQRRAISSCRALVSGMHNVELLFFMGDSNKSEPEASGREAESFGDIVVIGGPDSDPPVNRDATYVLDRPCARTYRLAHGTAWLVRHRPNLDFVMYLDDDSFLQLPRLFEHIERQNTPSLAMGFLMETYLDWSDTHVCELCQPCEPCRREGGLLEFCEHFPDMSLGGCLMAMQNCKIFDDGGDIGECVASTRRGISRLASYFGSKAAPRWMLGMGWVFGQRIARYIGRNAANLKVRGAADVALGFWLAPLEGVHFTSMSGGAFHDHPGTRSTFAAACSEKTVLVHRMNPERWAIGFDEARCELSCPVEEGPVD